MDHSQHQADAASAVEHADRIARGVAERSRWYTRFLVVFGIGVLLVTPLWGLLTGGVVSLVLNIAWVVFVIAITVYVRRQPVAARGIARHYRWVIGAWAVIYSLVLAGGFTAFPHNPTWWIPSGLAAAAPFFIGAYLEHRR